MLLILAPVTIFRFHCQLAIQKQKTELDTYVYVIKTTTQYSIATYKLNEETNLLTCAPNEGSNQPAHPRSQVRAFVVRRKKRCVLGYLKCMRPAKIQIRLHECAGWSESSLGAHVRRYVSDVVVPLTVPYHISEQRSVYLSSYFIMRMLSLIRVYAVCCAFIKPTNRYTPYAQKLICRYGIIG